MAKSKARVESSNSQKARTQRIQEQKKKEQQRQRLRMFAVIFVVIVAFVGVAYFVSILPADAPIPEGTETRYEGIPQNKNDDGFYVLGRLDAPVEVMEYSSFTCPACLTFYEDNMDQIIELVREGVINYTFVPRFVGDYPNPEGAAKAAFCAGEQGKFFEMQDVLFSWQTAFGNNAFTQNRLVSGADALGLDTGSFRNCVGGGRADGYVSAANTAASARGYVGAPFTTVNGVDVDSANLVNQIRSAQGNRPAVPLDSGNNDETAIPEAESTLESTPEATPELNLDIAAPLPLGLDNLYTDIPQSMTEDGGFLLGENGAETRIDAYLSYASAESNDWRTAAESVILDLVRDGQAAYVVYPHFAGMVSADTVENATKAAYCAAQQDDFFRYSAVLYSWQDQFEDEAFVLDRLVAGARNLGLDVEAFQTCINGEEAASFIDSAREMLNERGIENAPFVTVNGEPIELTVEALQAAVEG